MSDHDGGHFPKVRRRRLHATGEGISKVAEQPRPPQTATPHDHPVTAGFLDHPQGVLRGPDVTITQHGDGGDGILEDSDRVPVGLP